MGLLQKRRSRVSGTISVASCSKGTFESNDPIALQGSIGALTTKSCVSYELPGAPGSPFCWANLGALLSAAVFTALFAGAFWAHGADFGRELRQLLPYSPGVATRGLRILSRGTRERVPARSRPSSFPR